MKICLNWNEFLPLLNQKMILLSPFCGRPQCETLIKEQSTREEQGEQVCFLQNYFFNLIFRLGLLLWEQKLYVFH